MAVALLCGRGRGRKVLLRRARSRQMPPPDWLRPATCTQSKPEALDGFREQQMIGSLPFECSDGALPVEGGA